MLIQSIKLYTTQYYNLKYIHNNDFVKHTDLSQTFQNVIDLISQFSCSLVSDSSWLHGVHHARLPCPSPTPGACSNSCPWSLWCHPTISSCHPLLLPPSIFPSSRIFSSESALHIRWPKYWSFSFSISPSNGYSGLIYFMIDWFDLLAVQGTLQDSAKASILWHSAFFIVQLSHPYMTTGKIIALPRQTFVGKVMSPLLKCYIDWS